MFLKFRQSVEWFCQNAAEAKAVGSEGVPVHVDADLILTA